MKKETIRTRFKSRDDVGEYVDITEELNNQYRGRLIKYIAENVKRIAEKYTSEISRLDSFLKESGGAIGRAEDFGNWLFDRLPIESQGENLPEITDEQIILYTQEYTRHLKSLQARLAAKKISPINYTSVKWLGSIGQLLSLGRMLKEKGYIDAVHSDDCFMSVVNQDEKRGLPIRWMKQATKSKGTNKKALLELFNILNEKGLFASNFKSKRDWYNYITAVFVDCNDEPLLVKAANNPERTSPSECRLELEAIVKNITTLK